MRLVFSSCFVDLEIGVTEIRLQIVYNLVQVREAETGEEHRPPLLKVDAGTGTVRVLVGGWLDNILGQFDEDQTAQSAQPQAQRI